MSRLVSDHERGASAVLVAIMLVALVGVGALAVDAGALWSDRKQLQNGADAGALAVAQTCATKPSDPECAVGASTTLLAEGNKTDANAAGVVTDKGSNSVTVRTTSNRQLWLANVFGVASADVKAEATARWGALGAGNTIPLAFPEIDYKDGELCLPVKSGGDGPCGPEHTSHDVPGGFGWLTAVNATCVSTSKIGDDISAMMSSSTGNNPSCNETVLQKQLEVARDSDNGYVLFPVFNDTSGGGAGGKFHVVGFAAVRPTEWCLKGPTHNPNKYKCTGSEVWLKGKFVKSVTLKGAIDDSAGDFGAFVVQLAK